MNKLDLAGRVAIVTGGVSGIGLAIAQRMADSGATVSLWDRDADALAKIAKELSARTKVHTSVVDIGNHQQVVHAAKDTATACGKIDALVNSAGVAGANAMVWEYPVEEWIRVHNVNLHGTFYTCREVVPYLQKNGYGRIVNIASIAGKEGNPTASAYSSESRRHRSDQVARKGAGQAEHHGQLHHSSRGENADLRAGQPAAYRLHAAEDPDGRFGSVEEIASTVCWLCTEDASFSTGAVFDLSGGRATY
jgi:3-oxoacyl-[acyl-carrier protein] reductase